MEYRREYTTNTGNENQSQPQFSQQLHQPHPPPPPLYGYPQHPPSYSSVAAGGGNGSISGGSGSGSGRHNRSNNNMGIASSGSGGNRGPRNRQTNQDYPNASSSGGTAFRNSFDRTDRVDSNNMNNGNSNNGRGMDRDRDRERDRERGVGGERVDREPRGMFSNGYPPSHRRPSIGSEGSVGGANGQPRSYPNASSSYPQHRSQHGQVQGSGSQMSMQGPDGPSGKMSYARIASTSGTTTPTSSNNSTPQDPAQFHPTRRPSAGGGARMMTYAPPITVADYPPITAADYVSSVSSSSAGNSSSGPSVVTSVSYVALPPPSSSQAVSVSSSPYNPQQQQQPQQQGIVPVPQNGNASSNYPPQPRRSNNGPVLLPPPPPPPLSQLQPSKYVQGQTYSAVVGEPASHTSVSMEQPSPQHVHATDFPSSSSSSSAVPTSTAISTLPIQHMSLSNSQSMMPPSPSSGSYSRQQGGKGPTNGRNMIPMSSPSNRNNHNHRQTSFLPHSSNNANMHTNSTSSVASISSRGSSFKERTGNSYKERNSEKSGRDRDRDNRERDRENQQDRGGGDMIEREYSRDRENRDRNRDQHRDRIRRNSLGDWQLPHEGSNLIGSHGLKMKGSNRPHSHSMGSMPPMTGKALETQHQLQQDEAARLLDLAYHIEHSGGDFAKAFSYYQQAAELGYAKAQSNLGYFYFRGIPGIVEQSYEQAVRWFHAAACQGHPHALYRLGYCFEHNLGIGTHIPMPATVTVGASGTAISVTSPSTVGSSGSSPNAAPSSVVAANGIQPPNLPSRWPSVVYSMHNNMAKAIRCYELASEHGHISATCCLAYHLFHGNEGIVHIDLRRSYQLYSFAAELGHPDALFGVGFFCMYGIHPLMMRDLPMARYYFSQTLRRAANADALFLDAICCEHSQALSIAYTRNPNQPLPRLPLCSDVTPSLIAELYRLASELQQPCAQNNYAIYLQHGLLGPTGNNHNAADPQLAFRLFHRSAEQNLLEGIYNLAFCFHYGIGIEQDLHQAIVYYEKVIDFGPNLCHTFSGSCLINDDRLNASAAEDVPIVVGVPVPTGVGVRSPSDSPTSTTDRKLHAVTSPSSSVVPIATAAIRFCLCSKDVYALAALHLSNIYPMTGHPQKEELTRRYAQLHIEWENHP